MLKNTFIFIVLLSVQSSSQAMIKRMMDSISQEEYLGVIPEEEYNFEESFNDDAGQLVMDELNSKKQEYVPGDPCAGGVSAWAYDGDLESIEEAVENGYDINLANKAGETPLMYAAMGSQLDVLNYLLDVGAKTDLKDERGFSALMIAAELGRSDVVGILACLDSLQDYAKALEVARKQLKRINKYGDDYKKNLLDTIETLREYSKSFIESEIQKQFLDDDNVSEIIMSYVR